MLIFIGMKLKVAPLFNDDFKVKLLYHQISK